VCYKEVNTNTKTKDDKPMVITKAGPRLNGPNKNGRIYPQHEFEKAMIEYQNKIDDNQSVGNMGHQTSPMNITGAHVSHIVRGVRVINSKLPRKEKKRLKKVHQYKLWLHLNKKTLVDFEILPTESGKVITSLIDYVYFSMDSTGIVDKDNRVTQLKINGFDLIN